MAAKFRPPADDVISKPNWTSPTVASPIQPRVRIQFRTALMSTEPELVLAVRMKEKTAFAPLLPR